MLELFLAPKRGVAPAGLPANKKSKSSTTSGNAKGRMKMVSYCPECPIPNMADPETAVNVTVSGKTKQASCRYGHRWSCA